MMPPEILALVAWETGM